MKIHDDYGKSEIPSGNNMVTTTKNDIAIIKLGWPISYTHNVKPVCLPTTNDGLPFTAVEVSGFGKNQFISYKSKFKIIIFQGFYDSNRIPSKIKRKISMNVTSCPSPNNLQVIYYKKSMIMLNFKF